MVQSPFHKRRDSGTIPGEEIASMPEPQTIEEAEERRQKLTLDIQVIQAQLGEKHKTDSEGQKLDRVQYQEWRTKTRHDLNMKLSELRAAKTVAIGLKRKSRHPPATIKVVVGLLEIIDTWEDDFTPGEEMRIKSARKMVATASSSPY